MSFVCFKEFPKEKVKEVKIERDPDYKIDPDWNFFKVFIKFVAILFLLYVPVFGHKADGIPYQGSNLQPLHWKVKS